MSQVAQQDQALQEREQALAQSQKTLRHTEQVNQKLTYELALLKRHAFGKRSEQLNVLQISLLDEVVDADADHRQGHPHRRPAGPCADRQVCRSLAAVSAGADLRPRGVAIPRSTLAEWVGIGGGRLQPLIDALRELLLSEPVLHADETPVPMLGPGTKKTHCNTQIVPR